MTTDTVQAVLYINVLLCVSVLVQEEVREYAVSFDSDGRVIINYVGKTATCNTCKLITMENVIFS